MFNIMLDPLPTEYEGYPIDSDFQTGILIFKALNDSRMSQDGRIATALNLLFPDKDNIPDLKTAYDGLNWFLNDWYHDNYKGNGDTKATDYDIDQWRIYSAFREQYGINLNTDKLHFWEFMGLLTNLDECAYTRVIDIRTKKLTSKMGKEERAQYIKLKEVYALDHPEKEYTDEQKKAIDDYDRMMEEQKQIRERKKKAAEEFKKLVEKNS